MIDNPGIWAFHCHIQWHAEAGLMSQFIESPLRIQNEIKVPQSVYDQCKSRGIPTTGNAAGFPDTENFVGLTPSPVEILQ